MFVVNVSPSIIFIKLNNGVETHLELSNNKTLFHNLIYKLFYNKEMVNKLEYNEIFTVI